MTTGAGCAHRWSLWRPIDGGLLERRCPCGSIERGTLESITTDALDPVSRAVLLVEGEVTAAGKDPP